MTYLLIDRLGKAKNFSSLDLKIGYYQMPLREEDSDLTGFVTPCSGLVEVPRLGYQTGYLYRVGMLLSPEISH